MDSTNGDIFVNALERNRAELFEKYGKTEEQVDTFIQELIDKGLYIISCEL
nr:MAG TPA: bacterial regulatory protein [Caudoviricetes sp.]